MPALNYASEEGAHSHAPYIPLQSLLLPSRHAFQRFVPSRSRPARVHLYIYTPAHQYPHNLTLSDIVTMNGARTPVVEDPSAISKSRINLPLVVTCTLIFIGRIIQEEVDKTDTELETANTILLKIQEYIHEAETGLLCADILPDLTGLLGETGDSQRRGRELLRNNDERPPRDWVEATIDWVQKAIALNQRLANYRDRLYDEFPAHVVAAIERVAPRRR